MKRVTRLGVFLMIDCHKEIPLRAIELEGNRHYIVDMDLDELRLCNHAAIHIQTNEEDCE